MQKSVTLQNYQDIAILLLRLTTAVNFLSPVASRLGLWGKSESDWQNFVAYTGEVNSYASFDGALSRNYGYNLRNNYRVCLANGFQNKMGSV
jgi:hypothetical protein